ncbi:MAG: glycosyltransferase family 1 protein [Oscillatoriaceae cyanobacterium Prado104]|jgi:glycosyltransferase involved in cell wall biosynthesis|nr:glycosyltransferase family 1 protein [Oscillatoriaceae cyanobacterium Prado104]
MYSIESTDIQKQNHNARLSNRGLIRILHAVGDMSQGGIETWLMHILRHIDRERFQMDFLVHTTEPCAYDEEVLALGSRIIRCPHIHQPWIYSAQFKQILRDCGPYNIVHSHVHYFSGYILRLAKQAGVPIRIAHSHNDTSSAEAKAKWSRQLYLGLTRRWINKYATLGVACSEKAAADLFGPAWKSDPRWQILYYGIDLLPFEEQLDPVSLRGELGIPNGAFVVGHVGRFAAQKNHLFLLEIAAEIAKREPKMCLLSIGSGSLRPQIEQQAIDMGLSDRIIFAGNRPDVPRLMLGAMDVFLLPSLHEGLPVVGIEVQAAGLPFILSDVITQEVDTVKPLVQRISLSQPASVWADAVLAAKNSASNLTRAESLAILESSPFNIASSVKALTKTYSDDSCHRD